MIRNISDFTDTEYKQQAANANFTKIANIFGLKVTANKVLHTIINKNITNWHKVEVVSSMTALDTIYMGGSSNIDGVIVNMTSHYVGSNNVPLFDKKGLFGARLDKTAAASRYIFIRKGDFIDKYFNREDLNILPRYNFEGDDIEYQFFTFNVPLILINGTSGIGTGHSSDILPGSLEKIEEHLIKKLKGTESRYDFQPYFNGFNGSIENGESEKQWIIKGVIKKISTLKTEILEVPIGETYKSYIKKLDKLVEHGRIKEYVDLCQPKSDSFNFIIKHSKEFGEQSNDEILQDLKLISKISENYTLNDENNKIITFSNRKEIFDYYYDVKLTYMQKRKEHQIATISNDIRFLVSKYMFIKAITEDTLVISQRPLDDIEKDLTKLSKVIQKDDSWDYLLNMSIRSLTKERMEKLLQQIKDAKAALDLIKGSTIQQLWLADLV